MTGRSPTEPLRLGLIGLGRWGRNIFRTVERLSTADIAAVASRNIDAGAFIGPDIDIVDDYLALATRDDVDGLLLAVPPRRQPHIAMRALERNMPVLLQKPLAMHPEDAARLAQAARLGNTLAFVDHTYLFHPAFDKLCELVAHRGGPRAIRTIGGGDGPVRPDVSVLWDWAPHDIAMCLTLANAQPQVLGCGAVDSRTSDAGTSEVIDIELAFPDCRADIRIGNMMAQRTRRVEVDTADDTLVFDDAGPVALTVNGAAIEVSEVLPLDRSLETFVDLVRAGSATHPSLDLGCRVVETVSACAQMRAAT